MNNNLFIIDSLKESSKPLIVHEQDFRNEVCMIRGFFFFFFKDLHMNEIKVINEQTVLGKNFKIYGDFENPLFLAKDVAEWIDYSKTKEGFYQVSQMLANVDDDEKITINILNSEGKAHNQSFLTENGLYEVLMLSRKPIAKQFKKEVKKILHQLRTKGGYITEKGLGAILDNPDYLMELINESGKRLVEMRKRAELAENKNNLLMHSEKTYTMSEISKELGYKSAIEFNKVLYNDKIIFKRNGTWIPYSDYSESGYFEIKQSILENELVVYNLRVTQKGREFLLSKYSDKLF